MGRCRLGLVLTLLFAAAPAVAQSRCNQPVPSEFRRIVNARGQEVIYIGGPTRFICSDGVEIEADSAIWTQAASTLELLGDVFYQDSTSTLTSDWANYLGRSGQVFARGAVVLTDLETGSVVTGEQLDHQRETPERPAARSIISGGRPHAVLYRRAEPGDADVAAPDSASPPIEVDADWMRIDAGQTLRARGDVVLDRSGTVSSAEEMLFDQAAEHLRLERNARVADERFELTGRVIDGWLRDDELREVRAESEARLMGEELDVDAPLIHLELVDGELHRLQAWRREVRAPAPAPVAADSAAAPDTAAAAVAAAEPVAAQAAAPDSGQVAVAPDGAAAAASGGPARQAATAEELADAAEAAAEETAVAVDDSPQPVAIARGLRVVADSIDALAPGQELERVVAVGEAYGEQVQDSAAVAIDLPDLVARDWIRGDTITGYFGDPAGTAEVAEATPRELARVAMVSEEPAGAAADTARQRVLERLVVVGASAPARSLYRLERQGSAQPSINYMVASRIVLYLRDGEVTEVEAEGPVDGLFLDRPATPAPPGAGTDPQPPAGEVP